MSVSSQHPRSLFAALVLFNGWLTVLLGMFILIGGGKDGLKTAFGFLASGVAFIVLIYYRERSQRIRRARKLE